MKKRSGGPPKILEWLLNRISPKMDIQEKLGDFEELYIEKKSLYGAIHSWLWYLSQLTKLSKTQLQNSIYGGYAMYKNYIRIIIRNLFRNKDFSLINILGLAMGITCFIFIVLFIIDELSYDSFHNDADNIYRMRVSGVLSGNEFDMAVASAPMAHALKRDYPEVLQVARIRKVWTDRFVEYNNNAFSERLYYTDSTFFKIFSFKLLSGDPDFALKDPNSMVISESTASKLFGTEDPVGKVITYDNETDFQITGVIEDLPANTHMDFDMIGSLSSISESREPVWIRHNFHTYIKLRRDVNPDEFETKIQEMIEKYVGTQLRLGMGVTLDEFYASGGAMQYRLQPVRDIHLFSDLEFELESNGDIKYIYIFSSIALFLIIIACINYMNLATAKSAGRAKEIGIRKVSGSRKSQLLGLFISESLLLTVCSVIISVIAVYLLLPLFNGLADKNINPEDVLNLKNGIALVVFTIILGIAAGGYPAFFLASFHPINVLSGSIYKMRDKSSLRNSLVMVQFIATIFLLIGTSIIYNQLDFISQRKLGFNKEQVLVLRKAWSLGDKVESFRKTISQKKDVLNSSYTADVPGEILGNTAIVPEGFPKNEPIILWRLAFDYDFLSTLEIELSEGRVFSREFSQDTSAVILNETAVKNIGWEKPLGKYLTTFLGSDEIHYHVIGVVKDFHYETLHRKIRPMFLTINRNAPAYMCIRLASGNITSTLSSIESIWNVFAPGQPFDYYFLDDNYNSLYKAEILTGRLFSIFSILTVLIAITGLLGLVSYSTDRRIREIAVRKALGSSISGIVKLLTKEYAIWILIANIISWPSAWFVMNFWIQNFEYRTEISLGPFLIAGAGALILALSTVSFQAVRAASLNPAEVLKNE